MGETWKIILKDGGVKHTEPMIWARLFRIKVDRLGGGSS